MRNIYHVVIIVVALGFSSMGFSDVEKKCPSSLKKHINILKIDSKDISIDYMSLVFNKFKILIYGGDIDRYAKSKNELLLNAKYDKMKVYPKADKKNNDPFVLSDIGVDWDFVRDVSIWYGRGEVEIGSIKWRNFKAKNMDFSIDVDKKNHSSDFNMDFNVDKFEAGKISYGPIDMSFKIEGLKNKTLMKVFKIAHSKKKLINNKEINRQILLSGFTGDLKLDLGHDSDDRIKINAKMVVPPQKKPKSIKMMSNDLINSIYIKANIVMSEKALKSVVKKGNFGKGLESLKLSNSRHPGSHAVQLTDAQVEQQINVAVASGMLKKKGDNYMVDFLMKKGSIIVNGHKIK